MLALAPWAQPRAVAELMQGAGRRIRWWIALSDGHQCQPSWFIARAILAPGLPSGSGGIGGSCAG